LVSNFQDIALTKPKSAFSSMLDPIVTLNFELSNPKLKAFILVLKCTMLKVWKNTSNTFQDIVLTTFGGRMHEQPENITASAELRWQRHKATDKYVT